MEASNIKDIIDFDEKCFNEVVSVHSKKKEVITQIEKKKEELEKELWDEAKAKLAKRKAEMNKLINEDADNVAKLIKENMIRIEEYYNTHKDAWLKEIYNNILDA